MKQSINLSKMSYDELIELNLATLKVISNKRKEKVKNAVRSCMNTYGITMEEMRIFLNEEETILSTTTQDGDVQTETVVPAEVVENPQNKEILALPEPQPEPKEEKFPTMEELLSSNPEYKAYYVGKPSIKNKKGMVTMEELLSKEPVNQILCVGNFKTKDEFGQHTRVCDSKGICPTLTATGNTTYVYLGS